jgi:hypothetical protein
MLDLEETTAFPLQPLGRPSAHSPARHCDRTARSTHHPLVTTKSRRGVSPSAGRRSRSITRTRFRWTLRHLGRRRRPDGGRRARSPSPDRASGLRHRLKESQPANHDLRSSHAGSNRGRDAVNTDCSLRGGRMRGLRPTAERHGGVPGDVGGAEIFWCSGFQDHRHQPLGHPSASTCRRNSRVSIRILPRSRRVSPAV